jgi:oligopeptide transport system substrate-binding protein
MRGFCWVLARALSCALALMLAGCGGQPWNDPYPGADQDQNTIYSAFQLRPKHLDPARSYSANEYGIIGQIYEPPLQYAFLKRPYQLEPLTATRIPEPTYLDAKGRRLPSDAPAARIAFSVYTIHIKPGIYYQPHPAFARDGKGAHRYLHLTAKDLEGVTRLSDFRYTGTRELVASDYVYEIKRLANPALNSPIFSLMSGYIVGFKQYAKTLQKAYDELKAKEGPDAYLDLTRYPLKGVKVVDRYTYQIKVQGKYPQLLYWLAMPFFAPVPPEVDRFYSQSGMRARNISLDWYPVGTGAYMLTVNNPNRKMVLDRNPNFHTEYYPTQGEPGDAVHGWLKDAGKRLPFVHKVVYSLEKESIPYWNKFLQGYYDASAVSSDAFDQAIRFGSQGTAELTPAMKAKGIQLITTVEPSIYYMGFNMLDPVVGGYSASARKLRQALSIAVDYEDFISIFRNGRGIVAQGPLPPGIFGHQSGKGGIDPYVYRWVDGKPKRRSIAYAKRLLAEAGYPQGRSVKTGKPLIVHLDIAAGGPEDKALLDWYRKQFNKIDVELVVRSTDYNRFQAKMRKGNAQLFTWGWNADYPDPENFLFLLYGPNGKVNHGGENAANYNNPEFNRLFHEMKNMENGPQRMAIIRKMLAIVRRDSPWIWGFYPKDLTLFHSWYHNAKPNAMVKDTLKYRRIDPKLRARLRRQWNHPVLWPVWLLLGVLVVFVTPAWLAYVRKEREPTRRPEPRAARRTD